MNRILLVCLERSGSTILGELIGKHYEMDFESIDREKTNRVLFLHKDKRLVYKTFSVPNLERWNNYLVGLEWDKIVFLYRNVHDMMISWEHAQRNNNWVNPYVKRSNLKPSADAIQYYENGMKYLDKFYSECGENKIRVDYENIYHVNSVERRNELSKILDGEIKDIIIQKASPINKYTILKKTDLL